VNQELMRPVTEISMVVISALSFLECFYTVGSVIPACMKPVPFIPKVLIWNKWRKNTKGEPTSPDSPVENGR